MSTVDTLVLLAAIAAAVGGLYLLARHRWGLSIWRRPALPADPEGDAWDRERAVRRLVDSLPGIENLYQRLGFSVTLERECQRLLDELVAEIRVEIPDDARFRQALREIETQLDGDAERARHGPAQDPLAAARLERRDDPLLRAVLAAKEDPAEVTRLLDRDPIGETLPFVEQIPFARSGKVVWRTPMEISVLRKRPRDPKRFAARLEELRQRVRSSRIGRQEADRDAVLEAIGRCERDLGRENAYLPTTIRNLGAKLAGWLAGPRTSDAARRRRRLEGFLARLAEEQRRLTAGGLPPAGMDPAAIRTFGRQVQALGDDYLGTPWMHTAPLTARTLNLLVAAELAPFAERQRRHPGSAGGILARICAETASGHYDSRETVRRLHKLEEKGTYVHSLIFALLRLPRAEGR